MPELDLPVLAVNATLRLLQEGNTVPFIARYRKEATGGLTDLQIRQIQEHHDYQTQLAERRRTILESLTAQGKLTDELRARVDGCETRASLEDLYLPYRPKRRTRATIARERGLEPLAERILAQPPTGDPTSFARSFVDPAREVPDATAALEGAQDIVAEILADRADVRAHVRAVWSDQAVLVSQVKPEKAAERSKFEQYFDHRERLNGIPSHRYLAMRRGEQEGVLRLRLEVDAERVLPGIESRGPIQPASPYADALRAAIADSYKRLIAPSMETELRLHWKQQSDLDAAVVFASNLRSLLLQAPLGERAVLGIDPGIRTGCKCAAVDATGKFLGSETIYPVRDPRHAQRDLLGLLKRFRPSAVAIGNGTASRETEKLVRETLREHDLTDIIAVTVNEAGASIYSASDVAREEFPDLDVTIRGAISIARRLQDPLAELVKIDPKSIGVGQYQHDVSQTLLARKLDEVIESCVNDVGVEVNTASVPLLSRVAGVSKNLAVKIVSHREASGPFAGRQQLLKISGLGPRTFEQCAGFLRIRGAAHPLDRSAVHPERYELVEQMARDLGVSLDELVGDEQLVHKLPLERYVTEHVGLPTLRDIQAELLKPGRDPRDTFEPPAFREDVQKLTDLQQGMQLEGVVTNVTHFGAFVDVGVHQDGLVHISELADHYVKDPRDVVKVGDRIQVRVLEVDLDRQRIALSARKHGEPRPRSDTKAAPPRSTRPRPGGPQKHGPGRPDPRTAPETRKEGRNNPLGDLLKGLRRPEG